MCDLKSESWFLMRFIGAEADIDLDTEHPEFRAYQWVDPWHLPNLIVAFKKQLYEDVLAEFEESGVQIKTAHSGETGRFRNCRRHDGV